MTQTYITLRVKAGLLRYFPDALADQGRVPINVEISKLIDFFGDNLPQEMQEPFRQQSTAFLEWICEVGDEANLIQEYLGDFLTEQGLLEDLPEALNALTHKKLQMRGKMDYAPFRRWIEEAVLILEEPYITKVVIGTLLSNRYVPHEDAGINRYMRRFFLSLLK